MSDPGSPPPPPGQPPAGGPPPPPGQPQPYPGQPHPPGPPAPNYGQAYPPPPPPKKRRWPKILAVVLIGGLLFIGGCALLIWRLVSGPIDAANDFLADVAAEDYIAATEHLDPSCFGAGEVTPDALRAFFGDDVESYDLTSVNNDNNRTGETSGTITRAGFGEQPISFAMSKPGDDWLVCGFRIGN